MEKTNKIILHCDLNNFYASCECLKHPELRNYPMAVCGSPDDRHGIILAKNELAKKSGVKTAEVIWEAKRKCPNLVLVPPNMDEYIAHSTKVKKIYEEYTDLIEPFGIDECWLDVTGSTLLFGSGNEIADKIRNHVKSKTGLTISVGVSFTKIFAKLGSDMKKPDAVTCITKENFKQKVWGLNATEMLGVGKSSYAKMQKYGINTIGDIANTDLTFLQKLLGKSGDALWHFANGQGDTTVSHISEYTVPKSIGHSTTTSVNLTTQDEVWKVMYHLSEGVSMRLREDHLLATAVQITVKDQYLSVNEYQAPLPFPSRYPKDLCDIGIALFAKNYNWQNQVRLIGIRAINLVFDDESIQMSLLINQDKINEHEQLEDKIYSLRKRFGETAVVRASLMNKKRLPKKE